MIAWRIHWLTNVQCTEPTLPCTTVLADHEWRALYALATRLATAPAEVPSVEQVVIWIAQLGGFLNRKGDGYPGVTVLWRGWQRFQDALSMWLVFNPPPSGETEVGEVYTSPKTTTSATTLPIKAQMQGRFFPQIPLKKQSRYNSPNSQQPMEIPTNDPTQFPHHHV